MNHKKSPKQVENALNALFKKYKIQNKIDVETIKKWIWNAKGEGMEPFNKYQKKCFQLFPDPDDIDELNDILQVFVDAWNHFSHKELGGKAPCNMIEESMEHTSKSNRKGGGMPTVHVGGATMEWDEYEAILNEMERVQKPFKKWIEHDALPKYKKYLEQLIKGKKRQEDYYDVAHLFFQRALHLGFIDLKSIRPEFIQEEFPHWWPTHVMHSNYRPAQVQKALEILFMFLALVYKVEPIKYGF